MFTDVVMPNGMTGYELTGLAREDRPDLHLLSKPCRKRELAHFIRAPFDEKL